MFINHIFATSQELPPLGAYLYQYVVTGNGVFVRASRLGLQAIFRWPNALQASEA